MRLDFLPYRDSVTMHVAVESGDPVAVVDFDHRYPTFAYLRDVLERIVSGKTRSPRLQTSAPLGLEGFQDQGCPE